MVNAVKKNLIYFIYWEPSNGMLYFNLYLMNKYFNLFDGLRIVKVAGVTSIPEDALKSFPFLKEAEFVKNDPVYHERPHFISSLTRLPFDDSITFYAHAKGISRPVNNPLKWWVELMYKGNLEKIPDLSKKLFSGCFGKLRVGSVQVPVPWHYTGSFYWFKTKEVMDRYCSKEITEDIDNRWFTENFPGWLARQDEVLFNIYASDEKRFNCYREDFWAANMHLLKLLK